MIEEIRITNWNRGTRIFTAEMIPHGDNATQFHIGRAMWTKDTDDEESKIGFYHRYVNSNFQPCCPSNGQADLAIFVRRV